MHLSPFPLPSDVVSIKHCRSYLYGCLSEGLQPLSAALLHVDHILVVSLQRSLQAVHCLEHQVLALIQLLLKNLQGVNLKADRKTLVIHKAVKHGTSSFTEACVLSSSF